MTLTLQTVCRKDEKLLQSKNFEHSKYPETNNYMSCHFVLYSRTCLERAQPGHEIITGTFPRCVAGARGRGRCCTITLLHMNRLNIYRAYGYVPLRFGGTSLGEWEHNRLNKTESAIFVSLMCSLPSEDLHSELIL